MLIISITKYIYVSKRKNSVAYVLTEIMYIALFILLSTPHVRACNLMLQKSVIICFHSTLLRPGEESYLAHSQFIKRMQRAVENYARGWIKTSINTSYQLG